MLLRSLRFAAVIAASLAPRVTCADMLTLTAVADAYIISSAPDNNVGGEAIFDAGTDGRGGIRRGLVRFDLSGLPPGATVTSAVVQLTVVKTPTGGGIDSNFDLYRLNVSWGEGTEVGTPNGAPATTGEATWNSRLQNESLWTTPGAADDATGTASASTHVNLTGLYSWSGSALVQDVRYWQTNGAGNFGWLLRSKNENINYTAREFGSRESASGGTLVLGYTATPSPPDALTIVQLGTNVVVNWAGSFPLQQSGVVNTGYQDVGASTGPYTNAIGPVPQFFRLRGK